MRTSHERDALSVGRERRRSGIADENSRCLARAKTVDVEREPRTGEAIAALLVPAIRCAGADERQGGEIRRDSGRVHADRRIDEGTVPLLDTSGSSIDPREVALGRNHEPAACPGRPACWRRLAEQPLSRAGRRHDEDPPAARERSQKGDLLAVRRPGGEAVAIVAGQAAGARPIEVHADDAGSQACEGDPLSVGRKRRGCRGICASRELLETGAGLLDPENLLDPVPRGTGGEHDPWRLSRRPLRLSRSSGNRREGEPDHDGDRGQPTRPDRSVAARTCGAPHHLATAAFHAVAHLGQTLTPAGRTIPSGSVGLSYDRLR